MSSAQTGTVGGINSVPIAGPNVAIAQLPVASDWQELAIASTQVCHHSFHACVEGVVALASSVS